MAGSAAIFDLDRTLLRTSSTPIINSALFEAGLLRQAGVPGQRLLFTLYDTFGETVPSMALARAAALAHKGWTVDQVAVAAKLAGERLEAVIQPFIPSLFAEQRAAGRLLVLATTTPRHLVAPLAERLGMDAVIATTYATEVDSAGVTRYTGGLDGPFVWALGKLQAVWKWAGEAGVSLRRSAAFSDSVYDLPLLCSVGSPTAVNPDPRLEAVARLRRWPVLHLDTPPGVPRVLGAEPLDLVRLAMRQFPLPFARIDIQGAENVPQRGAAVVAANHRSYFDPFVWARAVFDAGRNPRYLAKKEMFDAPLVGQLMKAAGSICVDRERDGAAAFRAAEAALDAGELIVIAPQGTIPRGEKFFDPQLEGRSGAARLAGATGAPVIPLAIWGTEKVWPRSSRVPYAANVLNPPKILVRVGPPVEGLTGNDFKDDTEKIMSAIVDLLPEAARRHRVPTEAELARTYPRSHSRGDER